MQEHTYGTMIWHTCGHLETHTVTQATQSAIRQREGDQPCEYCREHPEQAPATPDDIAQLYHDVFAD